MTLTSDCTLNLIGTEASGTSVHMARSAVDDSLNALHVGLPGAVGTAMRVGHLNAEGDALVAEFAFGHVAYLLAMRIAFKKASTDIIADNLSECKNFFKKNGKKKFQNTNLMMNYHGTILMWV